MAFEMEEKLSIFLQEEDQEPFLHKNAIGSRYFSNVVIVISCI